MNKDKPILRFIAWELTQGCNLNCVHCRGSATPERNTEELSTTEAREFLDTVKSFAEPVIILSGGEPLIRTDIYEIAEYGTFNRGLRMVLATNVTTAGISLIQNRKILTGMASVMPARILMMSMEMA